METPNDQLPPFINIQSARLLHETDTATGAEDAAVVGMLMLDGTDEEVPERGVDASH